MSINLNVDVSGVPALLQRASALIAGNRAQHGANERLGRVKERAGDLDLAGKGARQKMADAFEAAGRKRLAEQRRQQDSWADRKPIGHRHGDQFSVAVARTYPFVTFWWDYRNIDSDFYIQPLEGSMQTFTVEGEEFTNTSPPRVLYYPYEFYDTIRSGGSRLDINFKIPVNKDTMICVYFLTYNFEEWLVPYPPANLGSGREEDGIYIVDGGPDSWDIYRRSGVWLPEVRYNSLPERREKTGEYSICVVVNKKSARAIPMPSLLKAKLREVTYRSYTPATPTVTDYISRGIPRKYVSLTGGSSSPAPNLKNLNDIFHLGLAGTGLSDSTDYRHGTPSIFAWLANPLSSYNITPTTYNTGSPPAIMDALYWGSGSWIDNADGGVTLKLPYTTKKVTQISQYDARIQVGPWLPYSKATGYQKIKVPASFEPYDQGWDDFDKDDLDSTFSLTWDWGRPGYCREQLYALGFTAADLTP